MSIKDIKINRVALIICLLAAIINIFAYSPGFMSPDSLDQYEQALTNQYTDWHPPIMAMLWHIMLYISNGPLPMMTLQVLLLWGSIYLLLDSCNDKRWYILIVAFAFAPFVQNFVGYIIKDSQMALSLLFAVSLMFRAGSQNRKLSPSEIFLIVLSVMYGGIVRPNALPAVLPLCILFGKLQGYDSKLKLYVYGFSLLILVLLANSFQNIVARSTPTHAIAKLYLHDLTGLYVATGDDVFPPDLYASVSLDTAFLRKNYTVATLDNIWWDDNGQERFPDLDSRSVVTLSKYWRKGLSKHLFVYINNRGKGMLYFLRLKKRTNDFYAFFPWISPNKYGFVHNRSFLSSLFLKPVEWQRNMPYMRPWFWLFLNIALFFFTKRICSRFVKLAFMSLLLSSMLYLLPSFFIFQVDTDFRYFYWNCIACGLAVILLVRDSIEHKKAVT